MADRKRQLGGHSFLTASDPCHIQDKIPYEFYCSIETTADYQIAVYTLSTTGMFDGILFLFLSAFFVIVVMTFTRFLLFCVCVLAGGSGPELDVVV